MDAEYLEQCATFDDMDALRDDNEKLRKRLATVKQEIRGNMRAKNYVCVGDLMKRLDEVLDDVIPENQ